MSSAAQTRLGRLEPRDEPVVRDWLTDFLRVHLQWWSEAIEGQPWSPVAIVAHVAEHDLVGGEWRELARAGEAAEDAFVRVARGEGGRALGIVHAVVRTDRYLRKSYGVLQWIYTDPSARGQGVATLLLDACDAWLAWRGVEAREVFVTAANVSAVRAYERQGYRIIDYRMLAAPPEPA